MTWSMNDCPDCWGVGELAPMATCPRCGGHGFVSREDAHMDASEHTDRFLTIRNLLEAKGITHSAMRLARRLATTHALRRGASLPAQNFGYPIAYYVGEGYCDSNGIPLRWGKDNLDGSRKGDVIVDSMTADVLCHECASDTSNWDVSDVLVPEFTINADYTHGLACDHCGEWIVEPDEDSNANEPTGGGDKIDPHEVAMSVVHRQAIDDHLVRRMAGYIVHTEDGLQDLANDSLTQNDWDFIEDMRSAMSQDEDRLSAEFSVSGGDHDGYSVVLWCVTDGNANVHIVHEKPMDSMQDAFDARDRLLNALKAEGVSSPDGPFVDVITGTSDSNDYAPIERIEDINSARADVWAVFVGSPNDHVYGPYLTREEAIAAAKETMHAWSDADPKPIVIDADTTISDSVVVGWHYYGNADDVDDSRRLPDHVWVDTVDGDTTFE